MGDGMVDVAKGLGTNKTLIKLGVSFSKLNDKSLVAFAKALQINSTLKSLEMNWNSFSSESVQSLAAALMENTSLTCLELVQNQIGDLGAQALALALKRNQTLKYLALNSGKISIVGLRELKSALNCNHSLKSLELSGNELADEEKYLFLDEKIFNHPSLIHFYPPDESLDQYLGGPVFEELQETQLIKSIGKLFFISSFFRHNSNFNYELITLITDYATVQAGNLKKIKAAMSKIPRKAHCLSEILDFQLQEGDRQIKFTVPTSDIRQWCYIGMILTTWLGSIYSTRGFSLQDDQTLILYDISLPILTFEARSLFSQWQRYNSDTGECKNNPFPILTQATRYNLFKKVTTTPSLRTGLGSFTQSLDLSLD